MFLFRDREEFIAEHYAEARAKKGLGGVHCIARTSLCVKGASQCTVVRSHEHVLCKVKGM